MGVVLPRTGRLADLGDPMSFVVELLAPTLRHITRGARRHPVRLVCRDSRSDPAAARHAVGELLREEGAQIIVTMAGTRVLPAVADTCEALGVPCVSTTFPWQAYYYGRGATDARPFRWTYHFAWGLDDIAHVFAQMWERLDGAGAPAAPRTVGCLWNDDLQGGFLRDARHGFAPVAAARGHTLVDPGGYREPAVDFRSHIHAFLDAGVEVVTSAATTADLDLFVAQAARQGLRPRLLTCSRWLAYPARGGRGRAPHAEHVATLVYWSPRHPYRSSLDGTSAAALAASYERRTGRQWLQPLGLAHALIEVAAHALGAAADPTDRAAVAYALGRTRLPTVAGWLDWTRGPVPNVATVPLAGGQWQRGRRHEHELRLVMAADCPAVAPDAPLLSAALTPGSGGPPSAS
ncbi:ABC transporter substrate-binding protein [Streptomyces sp. URMC 123]|uniref:ABC transporter substrate-binding protein n=1 Tax=Streptomyces sp. URMC 123 TaxID=3423403 RepID=UPI003F1A9A38